MPCPLPGNLSDPGIELGSLMSPALAGRFFTTGATWKAYTSLYFRLTRRGKCNVNCGLSQISTPPALLLAQLVKNPPAKQETWVRSLGWEDPLEKGKATHSSRT